jgi:hypothetical protein
LVLNGFSETKDSVPVYIRGKEGGYWAMSVGRGVMRKGGSEKREKCKKN